MSLIHTAKSAAKHRKATWLELAETVDRLEREADTRTCQLVALATEVDALKSERNRLEGQLDTAAIELSGARTDLDEQFEELVALRQFKANVCSVSTLPVPEAPEPTATRFDTGTVLRAGASPHAAHIPAWVTPELQPETDGETTQTIPIPVAAT